MKKLLTLTLLLISFSAFTQTVEEKKAARMEQLDNIRSQEVDRIEEVNAQKAELQRQGKTRLQVLKAETNEVIEKQRQIRNALKPE